MEAKAAAAIGASSPPIYTHCGDCGGNACPGCETAMAKPPKHVTWTAGTESPSSIGCHLERAGGSWQDDIAMSVACLSSADSGHGADVPGRRNGNDR